MLLDPSRQRFGLRESFDELASFKPEQFEGSFNVLISAKVPVASKVSARESYTNPKPCNVLLVFVLQPCVAFFIRLFSFRSCPKLHTIPCFVTSVTVSIKRIWLINSVVILIGFVLSRFSPKFRKFAY